MTDPAIVELFEMHVFLVICMCLKRGLSVYQAITDDLS